MSTSNERYFLKQSLLVILDPSFLSDLLEVGKTEFVINTEKKMASNHNPFSAIKASLLEPEPNSKKIQYNLTLALPPRADITEKIIDGYDKKTFKVFTITPEEERVWDEWKYHLGKFLDKLKPQMDLYASFVNMKPKNSFYVSSETKVPFLNCKEAKKFSNLSWAELAKNPDKTSKKYKMVAQSYNLSKMTEGIGRDYRTLITMSYIKFETKDGTEGQYEVMFDMQPHQYEPPEAKRSTINPSKSKKTTQRKRKANEISSVLKTTQTDIDIPTDDSLCHEEEEEEE